jgi:hypothetical protein
MVRRAINYYTILPLSTIIIHTNRSTPSCEDMWTVDGRATTLCLKGASFDSVLCARRGRGLHHLDVTDILRNI